MSMLSVQAQRLAEDGLSHSEIEAHLVHEGNPPELVRSVVGSLSDWIDQTRQRQSASSSDERSDGGTGSTAGALDLGLGLVLLVLGAAGSLAGPRIFIGALFVGVFRIFRGLVRLGGG